MLQNSSIQVSILLDTETCRNKYRGMNVRIFLSFYRDAFSCIWYDVKYFQASTYETNIQRIPDFFDLPPYLCVIPYY